MTCSPCTVGVREGAVGITFQFEGEEPNWLRALIRKFAHLMNLKPNWDSYGASPIEEKYVRFALTELLPSIMENETYLPEIVPTPKGSIQLEWHVCGIDLEARVLSDSKVYISYENLETGEEFEEEIEGDFERLKGLINQPRIEDFAPILSEKPLEIDLIRGGVNQMVDDVPQPAAEKNEKC